jgi:hypothetical protein
MLFSARDAAAKTTPNYFATAAASRLRLQACHVALKHTRAGGSTRNLGVVQL